MTQIPFTLTITDSAGASGTATGVINTDAIVVDSVTVSPDPAPANTLRTLTVVAHSTAGLAITYGLPTAAGVTFTPTVTPGQWTFRA